MASYRAEPRHVLAALRALAAQDGCDFEVVVLEDPPHGAARDAALEVGDPRIRYVANPEPMGLAAARNRLLELARGDLVAIADADDVCLPHRLALQAGRMAAEPALTVLGGAIEVVRDDECMVGTREYPCEHAAILAAMRRFNPFAHPTVVFRKDAVRAVGGYRALPHGTCDDYDLWSRLAHAGARFANLPEPLVRYRLHAGAHKARLLRATLRDTLHVKREHWGAGAGLADRARALGERALLLLPPRLVTRLFETVTLRRPKPDPR